MTNDVGPGRENTLHDRLSELEEQFKIPEADVTIQSSWDAIPDSELLDVKLPKLAWQRLLDTIAILPTLSIQSSTLAVLIGGNEKDKAERLGIEIARTALKAQQNIAAIRLLLMTATTGSKHE